MQMATTGHHRTRTVHQCDSDPPARRPTSTASAAGATRPSTETILKANRCGWLRLAGHPHQLDYRLDPAGASRPGDCHQGQCEEHGPGAEPPGLLRPANVELHTR